MLQGPQPSKRTRKKQINTRARAQTDYQRVQKQQQQQQQQQPQDDLLDLFGSSFQSTTNGATTNGTTNTDTNNNVNPFGDPFADFSFANNNEETKMNGHSNNNNNNNDADDIPKPKKKKKKKKKSQNTRTRAKTVQTEYKPSSTGSTKANNDNNNNNDKNTKSNEQKSTVKLKKIDVLPLLHKGIRGNKFKLNGNKSKVRTFFLTENNFYFCWEAVGQQNEKKGGLFSKNKGQSNRAKVDKDRSIPIRAIRSLQKNPAYMMQSYNFIPPQQKSLTLSIVYSVNGQDKKLNFMAYEPFHHQLFYEGLQQLIAAARDPKRNLSEVFELYVDFPKDILPKHLRPQRFKWEPLGDVDFNDNNNNNNNNNDNQQDPNGNNNNNNNYNNNNNNDNNNNNNNNNMYFDSSSSNFQNIDVYDPTAHGQFGRSRIKSF